MELFQELIFTVGLSLLVSFAIAKLFSMASCCDSAGDTSVSVSVSVVGMIDKEVFSGEKRGEKSVALDSESCIVAESVRCNELAVEEKTRAETMDSPLACGDAENNGTEKVREFNILKSCFASEEAKGGVLKEERVRAGGVDFVEQLFDESSERDMLRDIEIVSDDLIADRAEVAKCREMEAEDDVGEGSTEVVSVLDCEDRNGNEGRGEESHLNDDEEEGLFDDWEGIERTELEKRFGAAVAFVGSESNAERISCLDSDTMMQLYGLHQIAVEGPCCVPQPMALKLSSRAKWNSWQQLGDMSREDAMEQYITHLSCSIPGWMGVDPKDGELVLSDAGASTNVPFDSDKQLGTDNESKLEKLKTCNEECGMIGVDYSNIINREKE